jgi:hypothetical protein
MVEIKIKKLKDNEPIQKINYRFKTALLMVKKLSIVFNLICSSLVLLLPLVLYLKTGTLEKSLSTYYGTSAEGILTYSLLIVAMSFILNENIISGLLLIGVVLFDTYQYSMIHNLLAYTFFIHATYNIITDKRYRFIGIPMILFAFLIPVITFYWYEVIALGCLALHGFLYSLKRLKIEMKMTLI